MKRTFRIEKHEEYGIVGLAPRWMSADQRDPLTGMGAAHDILEHGANDRVEWQGLGGSIYVRGLTGYFSRSRGNNDPVENVASDFVQLFHLWERGGIPDPGTTRPLDDDDAEEMIQAIVQRGCAMVREEVKCGGGDADEAADFCSDENKRCMTGWLRKGYRAARARWRGVGQGMLCETFMAIEREVDSFLQENECYEGQECVVSFNPRTARVSIELERDPYDYE